VQKTRDFIALFQKEIERIRRLRSITVDQLRPELFADVEMLFCGLVAAGASVAAGESGPQYCRNVPPLVGVVGCIRDLVGVGLGDRLRRDSGLPDLHARVDVVTDFRGVQAGLEIGREKRLNVTTTGIRGSRLGFKTNLAALRSLDFSIDESVDRLEDDTEMMFILALMFTHLCL
jgi:hypothetical protein